MLEYYAAYFTYKDAMELTEELFIKIGQELNIENEYVFYVLHFKTEMYKNQSIYFLIWFECSKN